MAKGYIHRKTMTLHRISYQDPTRLPDPALFMPVPDEEWAAIEAIPESWREIVGGVVQRRKPTVWERVVGFFSGGNS